MVSSTFIGIFLLSLLFSSLCLYARTTPIYNARLPIAENSSYTWQEFERFVDARRGNQVGGLSELKKYLHHFGYLEVEDTNFTDEFDAKFELAINRYQAKLGLSVTGKLDSGTLRQIITPRCGVEDTPKMLHATRHYAFFDGLPRWQRSTPINLTYAFSPEYTIKSLTKSDIRGAFKRAFGHWESVIPVKFSFTDDYEFADIKIGFYYGEHGDTEPFDGVLGVLAHSYSPEIGRFHLDAAEIWAVDFELEKSKVAVDLESVATHEIGHLMGLGHSSIPEAVMYPSLKPRQKKLSLNIDDIRGIQTLYGSTPNGTTGYSPGSDVFSNDAFVIRVHSLPTWSIFLLLISLLCFSNSAQLF